MTVRLTSKQLRERRRKDLVAVTKRANLTATRARRLALTEVVERAVEMLHENQPDGYGPNGVGWGLEDLIEWCRDQVKEG